MKENYVYPILISKQEDGTLLVSAPDFPGQVTEATTEEEAITSAQELIALCIIDYEEKGLDNPSPSKEIQIAVAPNEKLVYVHLWMPYFRNATKEIFVKKTLTIPQWLDLLAKEKDLNFSAVLVKGLKKELGIDIR